MAIVKVPTFTIDALVIIQMPKTIEPFHLTNEPLMSLLFLVLVSRKMLQPNQPIKKTISWHT
jgi:hypothetical protein